MDPNTRDNLTDRSIWARILYMLFYAIAYSIAEFLVAVIAVFQAVVVLLTGRTNEGMQRFGRNLGEYIYQIVQFVTFNSEQLAFPFSDWPDEEPGESTWTDNQEPVAAPAPTVVDEAPASAEPEQPSAPDTPASGDEPESGDDPQRPVS